jgi:hypothetical protein
MSVIESATRRILIAGDSLFAEGLAHSLGANPAVAIVGTVTGVEAAIELAEQECVDAIVVAAIGVESLRRWSGHLVGRSREVPLIFADVNDSSLQIITSQRINARTGDLLAAIMTLPRPL